MLRRITAKVGPDVAVLLDPRKGPAGGTLLDDERGRIGHTADRTTDLRAGDGAVRIPAKPDVETADGERF